MRLSGLVTVAAVFAVCLTLAGIAIEVLVDWIWFSEVGYSEIFLTLLKARWLLFFSAFVSTLAFMLANAWVARQREPERFLELATAAVRRGAPSNLRAFAHARLRLVVGGVAVAGAGLFAIVEMGNWDVLLRFVYQVQYGQTDPVFGKDIGFYLFLAPGLCRAQELDDADHRVLRALRGRRLLGAGPDRIRPTVLDGAARRRASFRIALPVFRGQGMVVFP